MPTTAKSLTADTFDSSLHYADLPAFSKLVIEEIEPTIDRALAANREQIAALEGIESPTWDNFVAPLEHMEANLEKLWAPISHLYGVKNSDELRAAYNACLPKLTQYGTELGQNQALYNAYKTVAQQEGLSAAQKAAVDHAIKDFELSGVGLATEAKTRFGEILQQLALLSAKYSENVLDCSNAWSKHVTEADTLSGLPQGALDLAAQAAKEADKPGWLLALDMPTAQLVFRYADNRELRREFYEAWATRASDQGPHAATYDNTDTVLEILRLRKEAAQLLGFSDYSGMALAKKMATDASQVEAFLHDMVDKTRATAQQDLDRVQAFAKDLQDAPLAHWDIAYYSEKLKQTTLNFSAEELRPWFPIDHVMSGMFAVAEAIYGITIKQIDDVDAWHDDVRFYQVIDAGGNERGRFYTDLYARPKKRSGAWMGECVPRQSLADRAQTPVTFLVGNFLPASGGKPALLTHNEVLTLFHEFGHSLHGLLTQIDIPSINGINGVAWDAVELPSQFMENFCWDKRVLSMISQHYQSGEPLSDEKCAQLLSSRSFQAGLHVTRQLSFGLMDLALHTQEVDRDNLNQIVTEALDSASVIPSAEFARQAHSFGHIFAGGYAVGYYSYLWAEVLSADAFSKFEENGVLDRTTGEQFMKEILEVGGSREAMDAFVAFRGREPAPDALLKQLGL